MVIHLLLPPPPALPTPAPSLSLHSSHVFHSYYSASSVLLLALLPAHAICLAEVTDNAILLICHYNHVNIVKNPSFRSILLKVVVVRRLVSNGTDQPDRSSASLLAISRPVPSAVL